MLDRSFEEFSKVLEDPYRRLAAWKLANRRKVIGCLPMYAPEEMIHAAGILPVTLLGERGPLAMGNKHLLTYTCQELRSTFDMLLKGEFEPLDGILVPLICDQVRFNSDFWDMDVPLPFFHQIWLSFRIDPMGKQFLITELNRLKSHLEEFTGEAITPEAIQKSIRVYNENRTLLKKIDDLRKDKPGLIGASQMLQLVTSSMLMDKEEHSRLLTQFLSQIGGVKADAGDKIGLMVIGHPCWAPERPLLNLIEESGGIILEDDLFTGRRYFNSTVKLNGDPVESLADFFMESMPCPIKHYPNHFLNKERTTPDYPDLVIEMFRKSGAKGIIHLGVMYCDPYDLEYPYLKERLEKEKIPFLNIRTGLDATPLEPIRTRLSAFLEML